MYFNTLKINTVITLLVVIAFASRLEASDTCVASNSAEVHSYHSSNVFAAAQNLVVSVAGFFLVNFALYRTEWYGNQVGTTLAVFGISCVDVFLNLNNYVVTENSAYGSNIYLVPATLIVFILEEFRYSMQRRPDNKPPAITRILAAIALVLKNKLNFVVTENWFPRKWSKPPEIDSN